MNLEYDDNLTEPDFFTDRLTQENVKLLRSCAKGYVPLSELDPFIEHIAQIIVIAKHSTWLKSLFTQTQADAKADRRKLTALIKAIEALEGTEAMRDLSREFQNQFTGGGLFTYSIHGEPMQTASGKNVLNIVKKIAGDHIEKPKARGRRIDTERREIFGRLYDAWTQAAGGPPPLSDRIAFEKLAELAWEQITGEKNASFLKLIEEFRNKDGITK